MSGKRNLGGVAAVGLAAVFAALASFPMAMADELSDLRANQQLPQQQINHLPPDTSQATPPPTLGISPPTANTPAAPPPDQPLIGGSFPRSFVIPGTDTSVRVGGSIDETFDYRSDR